MQIVFPSGSPDVSALPDPLTASDAPPDSGRPSSDVSSESTPAQQFRLVLALYLGWTALAWLSQVAGAIAITRHDATIVLIGIGVTNALFFTLARSSALHRPPADTLTLAQCVFGIAWATLFALMSTNANELLIGIYASIVLFAMLRVRHVVLNQITAFAVISYSIVSLVKMLATEPSSMAPANLMGPVIFAGIMVCLSGAGRYVYRRQHRLEAECARLQASVHGAGAGMNSVSRRYILDLLAREKGRTDRSNIPFCICIFSADYTGSADTGTDQAIKTRALQAVEAMIRAELRDMDSLNATGFHDCFGAYSDMEFIAILPQTNLTGAHRAAERVLAGINAPHNVPDDRVEVFGGLAQYRRGETIAMILARAEEALDKARAAGPGHVCSNDTAGVRPKTDYAAVVRLETRRN